jgi:SOS-response transcriptional repressor LexA
MKPNDIDEFEWDVDLLMRIVGRAAYERIDPMDPRQQRFFEWLAREARLGQSGAERRETERAAQAFVERILQRRAAERAAERSRRTGAVRAPASGRLRLVNEPPPYRDLAADEAAPRFGSARGGVPAPAWDLSVAAGAGRELWEEPPTGCVDVPNDMGDGRYVALAVTGDSMEPLMHTGDTILIRLGSDVAADDVVVARHPERGHVVKRVGRVDGMRIELTSLNPAYEPLEIPNDAALILGTVVLRWRPHEGYRRQH